MVTSRSFLLGRDVIRNGYGKAWAQDYEKETASANGPNNKKVTKNAASEVFIQYA